MVTEQHEREIPMTAACREERQGPWLMFYRLECRDTLSYEQTWCHYKETWLSFLLGSDAGSQGVMAIYLLKMKYLALVSTKLESCRCKV